MCIYPWYIGTFVCRQQFVKSDGSLFRMGDVMYNKKLADTLDLIASDNGAWDMYNGSLARRIIDDLHDIGTLNYHGIFDHCVESEIFI